MSRRRAGPFLVRSTHAVGAQHIPGDAQRGHELAPVHLAVAGDARGMPLVRGCEGTDLVELVSVDLHILRVEVEQLVRKFAQPAAGSVNLEANSMPKKPRGSDGGWGGARPSPLGLRNEGAITAVRRKSKTPRRKAATAMAMWGSGVRASSAPPNFFHTVFLT